MIQPDHVDLGVPLILGLCALLLLLVLQTVQLVRERIVITDAISGQETASRDGDRVRRQLDGLLAGTSTLAGQGDRPAQAVLDGLRQQGIVYTPPDSGS